ncbi:hypothetical protein ACFYP6_32430 [Streptomyces goshikiensis]|uniref:hypothetical protein n=1 Tax=Streptomyces goshikiensis TaxID=1942 RepID=UPI003676D52D
MGHTVVVAVAPADLDNLDRLVAEQQESESRWQAAAEARADLPGLRGAAFRSARARIRAERNRYREEGRHRVTRWRALAPALGAELEQRGMLREWDPVPAGAQQAGQVLSGTGPNSGRGLTGVSGGGCARRPCSRSAGRRNANRLFAA